MASQKFLLEVEEKKLKIVISESETTKVMAIKQLLYCFDRLKLSTKLLIFTLSVAIVVVSYFF
jgi:hypothetical protein